MKNIKWIILIAVIVSLLVSPCANAKYVIDQKEILRDVGDEGIHVVIEELSPEAVKSGLTKDKIRTDVELKLRMAGIKVLSREEVLDSVRNFPCLDVNISCLSIDPTPNVVYDVRLCMLREVILVSGLMLRVIGYQFKACEATLKTVGIFSSVVPPCQCSVVSISCINSPRFIFLPNCGSGI